MSRQMRSGFVLGGGAGVDDVGEELAGVFADEGVAVEAQVFQLVFGQEGFHEGAGHEGDFEHFLEVVVARVVVQRREGLFCHGGTAVRRSRPKNGKK